MEQSSERKFPWGIMAVIAASMAVTSVMLYLVLYNAQDKSAARPFAAESAAVPNAAHNQPADVAGMVDRLAARLQNEPDNGKGWLMLARSQAALGRFADSAASFRKVLNLLPETADIYADYADVLAMAQQGSFQGAPEQNIQRALALDPQHLKALALAGTAAFNQGRFKEALLSWKKAIAAAPADSEFRESLQRSIADAEQRLGKTRK